jgi:hypothetical protein
MRWLGRKEERERMREQREVEPNDHGEATRDHELYLQESAPIVSTKVIPQLYPTRLGHCGLKRCR